MSEDTKATAYSQTYFVAATAGDTRIAMCLYFDKVDQQRLMNEILRRLSSALSLPSTMLLVTNIQNISAQRQ